MDRALDDIISERPRGNRPSGPRGGGTRRPPPRDYEAGPRDGIKKVESFRAFPNGSTTDIQMRTRAVDLAVEISTPDTVPVPIVEGMHRCTISPFANLIITRAPSDAKLRVENLHYELLEPEVRELFSRIGPVKTVQVLFDRHDRTTGTAFVTYHSLSDARQAVRDFDGANAFGQPIRVALLPPTDSRGSRNPFDSVEKPSRSLFERIDAGAEGRSPERRGRGRGRRSESPARGRREGEIDRYIPGDRGRERSPLRRRGGGRESGRRPGERAGGRGGRGGRKTDESGRPLVGGRPKKTQEELDAEMNDYWGKSGENGTAENGTTEQQGGGDGDVEIDLMVE
ncbi:hypothetical protein CAC42_5669 [Sphaceloma murrayae]|uniref:RRM domain-containing protein n=1 Tax=Sphaceloma murrayae TaxID=2082308 RepID=A0A2K1QYW8_9PEZI|nr:hypothetical protein CAC42_5669 [Sphaceloma murrayae]